MVKNIIRALRLPFITASSLPFIFGSLIARDNFHFVSFILGFVAVVCTHLSANLINDYADSKSGVDWQDKRFFRFFGGSKLIQQNLLSEKFYLKTAIIFSAVSFVSVLLLAFVLKTLLVIGLYLTVIVLGWSYSLKPLQLSYHRIGEFVIFLLFGPAVVMGGYFIQTLDFPDLKSFILSLPFGLLTTAVLFVNEFPDFPEDKFAGKFTWISLTGQKNAFIIFYLLVLGAFIAIALSVGLGYLSLFSALSFVFVLVALQIERIMKQNFNDKTKLMESSKLTIDMQMWVSIVLILDLLL
jgi:1,4-dihydroxy-2-naphthoate octaprenyltransferase